jgi:predicted GIY-YIG superfamily endonuclease
MSLPTEITNLDDTRSKINKIVNKSRGDEEKTDSVYVLMCSKPDSKEAAMETAKPLLEEYRTGEKIRYRDHSKEKTSRQTTKPNSFSEALKNESNEIEDDLYISYPYWIERCYKAKNIFYVGWSNDVEDRIMKHLTDDGALFTKIFPPIKIEEIRWYSSKQTAKKAEGDVADEYSDVGRRPLDSDSNGDNIEKYAYYFWSSGKLSNSGIFSSGISIFTLSYLSE